MNGSRGWMQKPAKKISFTDHPAKFPTDNTGNDAKGSGAFKKMKNTLMAKALERSRGGSQ